MADEVQFPSGSIIELPDIQALEAEKQRQYQPVDDWDGVVLGSLSDTGLLDTGVGPDPKTQEFLNDYRYETQVAEGKTEALGELERASRRFSDSKRTQDLMSDSAYKSMADWKTTYAAGPAPMGYTPGTIDPHKSKPSVNQYGDVLFESPYVEAVDGTYHVIPSVDSANGRKMSREQALERYRSTGESFGSSPDKNVAVNLSTWVDAKNVGSMSPEEAELIKLTNNVNTGYGRYGGGVIGFVPVATLGAVHATTDFVRHIFEDAGRAVGELQTGKWSTHRLDARGEWVYGDIDPVTGTHKSAKEVFIKDPTVSDEQNRLDEEEFWKWRNEQSWSAVSKIPFAYYGVSMAADVKRGIEEAGGDPNKHVGLIYGAGAASLLLNVTADALTLGTGKLGVGLVRAELAAARAANGAAKTSRAMAALSTLKNAFVRGTRNPTTYKQFLKQWVGKSALSQTAENLSELSDTAMPIVLARAASDVDKGVEPWTAFGNAVSELGSENSLWQMREAVLATTTGTFVLNMLGLGSGMMKMHAVQKSANAMQTVVMQSLKTANDPVLNQAQVKDMVGRQTSGTAMETVSADIVEFEEAAKKAGMTPEEVATEIDGSPDAYLEAKTAGTPYSFKYANFVSTIGRTKNGTVFAPVVRRAGQTVSAYGVMKKMEQADKDAQKDASPIVSPLPGEAMEQIPVEEEQATAPAEQQAPVVQEEEEVSGDITTVDTEQVKDQEYERLAKSYGPVGTRITLNSVRQKIKGDRKRALSVMRRMEAIGVVKRNKDGTYTTTELVDLVYDESALAVQQSPVEVKEQVAEQVAEEEATTKPAETKSVAVDSVVEEQLRDPSSIAREKEEEKSDNAKIEEAAQQYDVGQQVTDQDMGAFDEMEQSVDEGQQTQPDARDEAPALVSNLWRLQQEHGIADGILVRKNELASHIAQDMFDGFGFREGRNSAVSEPEIRNTADMIASALIAISIDSGGRLNPLNLYQALNIRFEERSIKIYGTGPDALNETWVDKSTTGELSLRSTIAINDIRQVGDSPVQIDLLHESLHSITKLVDALNMAGVLGKTASAHWSTISSWLENGSAVERNEGLVAAILMAIAEDETRRRSSSFTWFRGLIRTYIKTRREKDGSHKNYGMRLVEDIDGLFSSTPATDTKLRAAALFFFGDTSNQVVVHERAIDTYEAATGTAPLLATSKTSTLASEEVALKKGDRDELYRAIRTIIKDKDTADRYYETIKEGRQRAGKRLADNIAGPLIGKSRKIRAKRIQEESEKVREELDGNGAYVALGIMQNGKMPSGERILNKKIKLNEDEVIEQFGHKMVESLNSKGVEITSRSKTALSLKDAAAFFGYDTGKELIMAVSPLESIDDKVEKEAHKRVTQRYGDIAPAEMIDATVTEAVNNAGLRAKRNKIEREWLMSSKFAVMKNLLTRIDSGIGTDEEMELQAHAIVANKRPADINPMTYQKASERASKAAKQLFWKGDYVGAVAALEQEAMNIALYNAAVSANKLMLKTATRISNMKSPGAQKRIGKAQLQLLEWMNTVLYKIGGTRSASRKIAQARKNLVNDPDAFEKSMSDNGYFVHVPQAVRDIVNGSLWARDMSISQWAEVLMFFDQISKIASDRIEQDVETGKARKASVKSELLAQTAETRKMFTTKAPNEEATTLAERLKELGADFFTSHIRMEFLFKFLDGGQYGGAFYNNLFKPFVDAEGEVYERNKKATAALDAAFSIYTKEQQKTMNEVVNIGGNVGNLSRRGILMVVLNYGNAYNADALLEGSRGWTKADLDLIFTHVRKEDLDVAQAIWDHFESYWPEVREQKRRHMGVDPERVEAREFETKFGTYKGGYFPVSYVKRSWMMSGLKLNKTDKLSDMFGRGGGSLYTKHGYEKARTDSGGRPIRLSTDVINEHIQEVIHDLVYRDRVMAAHNVITDKELAKEIVGIVGDSNYGQIEDWLRYIASAGQPPSRSPLDRILSKIRNSSTVVTLGARVTTLLTQSTGSAYSIKEIGGVYFAKGVADAFDNGNPIAVYKEVAKQSSMMANRLMSGGDREVADLLRKSGLSDAYSGQLYKIPGMTNDVINSFVKSISYAQMAVDLPTWLGAKRKAMDGAVDGIAAGDEKSAIDYADHMVRTTQGATGIKDLPSIQRGPEVLKLFVAFYSFFSIQANQILLETGKLYLGQRTAKDVGSYVAAMTLLFAPVVLDDLINGRDDPFKKGYAKRVAGKVMLFPFQGYAGMRDVASALEWGRWQMPAQRFGENIKSLVFDIPKALIEDKNITETNRKEAVRGIGNITMLPTDQMQVTYDALVDWMDNAEDYWFLKGVYRLGVGKPRE